MNRPNCIGRHIRRATFGALALSTIPLLAGCLDRPVAPASPNTSARVVERAKQDRVNAIDLLFMIDNSSSMADKQAVLSDAIPQLVKRLVNPGCINQDGTYNS